MSAALKETQFSFLCQMCKKWWSRPPPWWSTSADDWDPIGETMWCPHCGNKQTIDLTLSQNTKNINKENIK